MISQRVEIPIVVLSVRVYQALLVAYPIKFQQKYGSDMIDVFRSCCLRAFRRSGTNGMVRLWAVTLLDLIQSLLSEHAHKEIEMKKEMDPEIIRLAGGALIWGAVTFVVGMFLAFLSMSGASANFWAITDVLVLFMSMPLFVIGLLGLRSRYGEKAGWLGKNMLLLGVIIGPLISLIGFAGGANKASWSLIYSGPAVLLAGLTLFGFVALYKRPLPRWNVVPVIAGIGYPMLILFSIITPNSIDWEGIARIPMFMIVGNAVFIMHGIALAALGYILKSD